MSRILVVSDIHIHDYPQRNPSEKYRLYQTRLVTQNILETAKEEGADRIFIAGDIMDKWNPRPYVQAEIKLFLDTLMSYFKEGYLIYGNHDQDGKTVKSEFIDSCLSVMLPPNLYYADMKTLEIEGCTFAFYNWRPEFDLSWIQTPVDYLITHATISYSPDDHYTGQKLDEGKFGLAVCGDIHKPVNSGKFISIGIPQRCKMGDSDLSTCVIIDCPTKQWKWANLNKHDNLMKFEYTPDRDAEGWYGDVGIYKVYKPENLNISGGIRDIQVPAWEEIDHLITEIILQNGLQEVHGEVLQGISGVDSKEVDFNFVILHLSCKNWRSIDEADLYFADLDRVLITGENGSGKSSLLSALKYAFLENRSIKDFLQFGTKECWTEVEFLYQGNLYKIRRGFQGRGGYTKFWINGEEQKANSKADLDEDLHVRFPFIDYMDVYFFDSDHHKLIGGITAERKSEIISKFYKMDKIDAFNSCAEAILSSRMGCVQGLKGEINKGKEVLSYIEGNLNTIILPSLSRKELEEKKASGIQLQRAWTEWNNYMTANSSLKTSLEIMTSRKGELMGKLQGMTAPETLDSEIQEFKKQVDWIQQEMSELKSIETEGHRVRQERNSLEGETVCRMCGKPLDNLDLLEQHKSELDRKLADLGKKWSEKMAYISNTLGGQDPKEISGKINSDILDRMSQKRLYTSTQEDLKKCESDITEITRKLSLLGPEPVKVELPGNFVEEMAQIEASIGKWSEYEKLMSDRDRAIGSIQGLQDRLDQENAKVQGLQDYIKLTGPTGKIYEEIMTRLADMFTDSKVKYTVERTVFRKKEHLELASYYLSGGNEVSYQACSSGQKTILDINFLGKVVTRMGLLVMDEFLKHLDAKNHDICIEMLKDMNIGLILLSSHMESVPAFNNKSLFLELNESGITKLTMK